MSARFTEPQIEARSKNRGSRSSVAGRVLSAVAGLGFAAALGLVGLARAQDESGPQSPKTDLPEVERPAASQPPVGLVEDTHLNKTPPRETKGLDLVKLGWTYNCMECHKLLKEPKWHYDRPMVEHQDIKLEHGNNRFCLNCHHPTNRNAFVDYDGSEILEEDVVLLCAKCHGPIYRDWKAGVHGRQNGYWKKDMGDRTKLRCIQCHDPHRPKFQPMKPLPPLRYPPRAAGGSARAHGSVEAHH